MERVRQRSGFSLIEVLIAVMTLAFTAAIFAALMPQAARMRHKSENVTRATLLARRKVEQIRALDYASLGYDAMRAANIIDPSPATSPFQFTEIDSLSTALPGGAGTITLTEDAVDLHRVDVTVSWEGPVKGTNEVTVTTLIANKAAMEISGS